MALIVVSPHACPGSVGHLPLHSWSSKVWQGRKNGGRKQPAENHPVVAQSEIELMFHHATNTLHRMVPDRNQVVQNRPHQIVRPDCLRARPTRRPRTILGKPLLLLLFFPPRRGPSPVFALHRLFKRFVSQRNLVRAQDPDRR